MASLSALVLFMIAPAPPAHASTDGTRYVAIGDSYSAGVGTHGPITDACYRSPYGYPPLVAQRAGWQLDYQACSGAKTSDVLGQLGPLSADTDVVTIGVGGNDVDFGLVMNACSSTAQVQCEAALALADRDLGLLPTKLDALYGEVAAKAPNARIAVVGYPHLFARRDCSRYVDVTRPEMRSLNAYTDRLDAILRDRAHQAGFQFVDVRDEFAGHEICTDESYIRTYVPDPVYYWDSFHPNRAGHRVYARAVLEAVDRLGS